MKVLDRHRPDLKEIEKIAVQIENALSDFPDTRSVFAERTTGGYFLDFTVDREAAARYGLRVQDVNDIIESAIGGKTIAMTVEGRERYPINVRYARDFRDDLDSLKRVLVPMPTGAQVPISMLAEISNKTGPPSIRNENAQLVGFVFVDITRPTQAATSNPPPSASVNVCNFRPAITSSGRGSSSILRPLRNASRSSSPSRC